MGLEKDHTEFTPALHLPPSDNDLQLIDPTLRKLKGSAIRGLLEVAKRPEVISFAGGLPAPETFLTKEELTRLFSQALEIFDPALLQQYGETRGFPPFLDHLMPYLHSLEVKIDRPENILISTGSQQAIDLFGRVFITPGTKAAVEGPTFVGALQSFTQHQADIVTVPTDEAGIIPDALKALAEDGVKLLYFGPTNQNPSGQTLTFERRYALATILKEYEMIALEDDPYNQLTFDGKPPPPVQSLAPDRVVYTTTMSKVLSPSFRIGITVAPDWIWQKMEIAKQASDLFTSDILQAMAAVFLANGSLEPHMKFARGLYKKQRDAMLSALDDHFPQPEFRWTTPRGGFFIFVWGPETLDTQKALESSIAQNVAFVPGAAFYANPTDGRGTIRLNYSNRSPEMIEQGIAILGEILKRQIR